MASPAPPAPTPLLELATLFGRLGATAFGGPAAHILSAPLVPWLRASPVAAGFLDGVNVASLALMAVVTVQLGGAAIVDLPTAAFALLSAVLLLQTRVGPTSLMIGGAVCGILVHLLAPGRG